MDVRQISGWQIVALVAICAAVVAVATVALVIGRDGLIAIGFVIVAAVALTYWLMNL